MHPVTGFGSAIHDGFEILDRCKFEKKSKEKAVLEAVTHIIKKCGKDLNTSEDKARGLGGRNKDNRLASRRILGRQFKNCNHA